MTALSKRGHEVRRLDEVGLRGWPEVVQWCDVLHIHRVCDESILQLVRDAKAAGAAVVWDDDDDTMRPPRGISGHGIVHGARAGRLLAVRRRLFELVDLVTTPSPLLADIFLEDGAPAAEVIENYVLDNFLGDRLPRNGITIGWVACLEHQFDLERLAIERTLADLLEAHPRLRVTTLGVRLDLRGDRYTHIAGVPLRAMLTQASAFDIGIAPLSADVRINHTRSNVKLKEYSAVGVPWLASPVGPYVGLSEKLGGRLVADDRWREELDALIRGDRTRRRLAKRAARWGAQQALTRNVDRWERALERALGQAQRAAA